MSCGFVQLRSSKLTSCMQGESCNLSDVNIGFHSNVSLLTTIVKPIGEARNDWFLLLHDHKLTGVISSSAHMNSAS